MWDAAGYGVVLLKAGWEVVHLAFVAVGVAWICYETPIHHCHSNGA